MDYNNLGIEDPFGNQQLGTAFPPAATPASEGPTAFRRGFVNFADQQTQFAPAFTRSRDMMTLDADPYGTRTQQWAAANGLSYDTSYVAGLNVFGRAMSREQLEQSDAGRELLRIATNNRLGKKRGFWDAIKEVSWNDLPFVGMVASVAGSASDAFQVHETMRKLQDGAPVTDDELIKTRAYLAKQEWDAAGSWGATVGDIVRQAPGFVAEFVATGGLGSAARVALAKGAVEGAERVGSRAVSLAVGRGIKRLTKELADEGLEKMAKGSVGAALSPLEFRKGVAEFISGLSEAQKVKFAHDLSISIAPLLKQDLKRTFGEKASYMYTDKVVMQMAHNLARSQMERSVARMGASKAFTRFGNGLVDFTRDHLAAGFMDFGTFGTPTSTTLFGAHNKAGRALKDALGILLVDAPVKGALQFGVVSLAREGIMFGATGGDYVTDAQLDLESKALQMGNRQLMDSAGAIALGLNFLEYASENSGRGFTNLFRSAGLATGLAKQATRMYEGHVGGILAEAKMSEAGGFLRGLIRKAVGSWEQTAERTAEARVVSVLNFMKRNHIDIDRMSAARIANGDLSHITDDVVKRFVGGDAGKFVTRAIKDEAGRTGSNMTYRSYLRYWAADKMVKNHWGPDELANAFQRMGYDGIVEEMMEERYTDFAKGLFGLDEKGHAALSPDAIVQALKNITPGTEELPWDQLTAEAVGFAIPLLTKSAAMRVMRDVGGPAIVGEVRETSLATARAVNGMTAVERSIGDFRADHEATMARLSEETEAAKAELSTVAEAVRDQGLVGADARDAMAPAREKLRSVLSRVKAQEDAYERILEANGLSTESIAEEAVDRLMFVPVVSAHTEQGDLKEDKLRVDRSSDQLQDSYGAQGAAVSNAWKIGKAQFDAVERDNEDDPSVPWYRTVARKTIGIAAAIVTGDPSLAMRDYAKWAAVDEGLDPFVVSLLHSQYQQDRQDALDKIRNERAEEQKKAGNDAETGMYAVSEDQLWERMAPQYKKNAAAIMSSYLSMKNVHMFAQSDIREKVVDYLARRAGYSYRDGAYEKDDGKGEVSRLTAADFATANAAEVDRTTAEVSSAVVRILADRSDVDLGGGSVVSLFQLPADASQRERTALAIATKLAGFGNLFTSVRLGKGQSVEDAAEVYGMNVQMSTLDRIRKAAVAPDGTVDYNAPDEKDILEVAAGLRRGVTTGSDAELDRLRHGVVDIARQVAVVDDGRTMTYSAPIPETVYMKDRRLYGKPYVDIPVRMRSDGQWVATVDTTATKENAEGKIDIVRATPEEMDKALGEFGYKRREHGVVVTPTMVVSTADPIQLAQQLGLMREYVEKTSRKTTDKGVVDPRYVHPLLRKDENNDYVNTPEQADSVLRTEMLKAWMYDRFGEDASRYPAVVEDLGEGASERDREKALKAARERARNEARIAHDALYGEQGYMTVLNDMLRAKKVTVPGDGGLAGMFTGGSTYSVGLNHVRAVAGSAKHYVSVNFNDGQSDSGAILNAVLEDAFSRNRRLVSGKGRFSSVLRDFLKYLHVKSEVLIYGDRVTNHEREALIRFRDDIASRWQNPTSRAFREVAGAFALFMAEKDKAEGSTGFSQHSLAYQALSTNELYSDPQFLRFFALVDMMLGGNGFSYELAARRLKAGDVTRSGVARIMDVFGTDTEPLRKMINDLKPLGKTYEQFTEEVNRQAQSLNPKVAQAQAAAEKPPRPKDASGLVDFIRNTFGNAHFDSPKDAETAFNALAEKSDAGLRRTFLSRAADFARIEQRLSADLDGLRAKARELEAEKRKSDEARDTAARDRNAIAKDLADLQEKVDGVVMALNDIRRVGGKVVVQSDVGGGNTAEDPAATMKLRTAFDRLVPPSTIAGVDEANPEAEDMLGSLDDNDDEGIVSRFVPGDSMDVTTPTSVDFDDNGNPVVVDYDSASADLPKEACEFGASAIRSMLESATGSTDLAGYEEFSRYLDKIGTFRDAEKRRLYGFYKGQAVRAEVMRLRAELADEDEDDEGAKASNDQNFNDKLLKEYQGKELDAFLTIGSFVAPEEGRSLQGILDSIRGIVVRRLASVKPGSAMHDTLSRVERILNPRAVTEIRTKEYNELTKRIEQLRKESGGENTPEIEKLRVERAQLFTNGNRESEWRRAVKELSAPGREGGTTMFDQLVSDLLAGNEPSSGRAAFLLSFLKSLGPAKQVRLLSLCANSAVCSRVEVGLETGKLEPVVGQKNSLSSRAVSAAFAPLRRMSRKATQEMAKKVRQALMSAKFDYNVPGDLTVEIAAMRKNFGIVADALSEYLGEENPLICILRSDSLARYIRTSYVFGGLGSGSYTAMFDRIVVSTDGKANKSDIVPEFAKSVVNLLDGWARERSSLSLGDSASAEEIEDALDRIVTAWFAYGVNAEESASVGHKQAMYGTIWRRIFETYAASRPVTVAPSVYIPGRSVSTSSKVVVAAPGVVPAVAQWMDRPISDKTSFAYLAKNFMLGSTGDVLRKMSDADFLEKVYPECRQTMTWPDAQHTPILAKNLTRDFTPDYMHDRCEDRFHDLFGSEEGKYGVAETGASTYVVGKTKKVRPRVTRWYSPVFAGEHTSGVILQLPGMAYVSRDGNSGEESIVSFVKAGESFDEVSTRLNLMMGLAKLGDDAKRAALTTAQVPAVSLQGSKLVDGSIVYGETRVHALVSLDPSMSFANQEALKGLVVGVGYGVEEQRKVASDPESGILKLHYMSTSGADLEMFKGLTVSAATVAGLATGLYAKGTVVRAMQEHLLKFRKNDADISTSIMTDRDGLKVCVLNSKVVGVPYVDRDGNPARKNLLDYIISKLRDVDVPDGGLDLAALDKLVGDGKEAPEGADAKDYRPGTFDWSYIDENGVRVDNGRRTLSDLLGGGSGMSGIKVSVVKGLRGKAIDISYVDNGLMSYTVANVSHESEPETGRAARNTMLDAATMATVQVRGKMATGHSAESARRIRDNFANWGLLVAAIGADPRLVDDSRFGAGRSSKVEELVDGKGDDPNSLLVDNQLAYDVMKRVRSSLNLPLNQVACALVSGGAMYDDKTHTVQSLSDDPFLRYAARGSRVFSKSDRANKYNGIARSFGWGQINVRSDGFRYAWHLDRQKFAENYGEQYGSASSDRIRVALDEVFTALRRIDDTRAEAHKAYAAAARTRAADEAARRQAYIDATDASRKARLRLAECFVDHYGHRVSEMKVQFEQKRIAEKASGQSRDYRDSVSFDDLFLANPKAEGPARIFDRSAVHGGDEALRLGKDEAAAAGAAHMAVDADPVVLAGTAFGLPRTPSYNGSMWLQVLRASIPASTVEDADGNVVMCGRDAAVIPDAQSLQILGCDHDGDKSSCYLLKVDTRTGRADIQDIPDASDPEAEGEMGSLLTVLSSFDRDPEVRRRYLDRMVAAGLVSAPVARKTKDGRSLNVYRIADGAADRVSNAFVAGMFDLARNTVQESPDEETDFYGTHLARATRFQPVNGAKDDDSSAWGRLVKDAGDAAKYLKGKTLADSRAGAHVSTSAMSADRARGQIVSYVGNLHFALMSGKYDGTFFRGDVADKVNAWFDFIYGLDGISNATFDDLKEQICRRLGWTAGMIDTVVADLMFTGDKVPTTEDEFFNILDEYVKEIANHGSRYYMMATAEPAEGNEEFTKIHVDARTFALGDKYDDGGERRVELDTPVSLSVVLKRFHIMETRNASGGVEFRLAPDCRSSEGLAAVKDSKVRAVLSPIVAARGGIDGGAPATDAEKAMCEAVVRSLSSRRGDSAGLGYVFYLVETAGKDGVSRASMGKFLRWYKGVSDLTKMREFVNAANYTKADPGDAGKMGRRGRMNEEFDKVMETSPAGENDEALRTLNTAVRTIYGSGLMPIAGRGRLAAESRGDALIALNRTLRDGHARDVVRTMIGKLACMPAVSTVDDQRLQANLLSDSLFIAALRTVPAARAGTSLFGDRQYTWAVFDAIAEAVQAALQEEPGELPRSMALRRGMESILSVMYSLVSASSQGADCPAFGYMSLNYDYAYDETFKRNAINPETMEPYTQVEERYPGAIKAAVRRLRPTFAMKDDVGLRRARKYIQRVVDGAFDKDGAFGKRSALYTVAHTKAGDFSLSIANLMDFAEESKSFDAHGNETAKESKVDVDIRIVQAIINKIATSVLRVDPGKVSIQPSTVVTQLIPVYTTMTEQFGSNNSVIELIPGLRQRLTSEQARLFSGALDDGADVGMGFWDILAATAHAPVSRLFAGFNMSTPNAENLTSKRLSSVLRVLDHARAGVGNSLFEGALASDIRAVSGGVAPSGLSQAAPKNRVMIDTLGPFDLFRTVHEFVDDMMLAGARSAIEEPAPEPAAEVADTTVTEPDPAVRTDAERLVPVLVSTIGKWADIEHVPGTDVIKVRARGGLRGMGASRFANGGRTDMVITIRLGSESRSGVRSVDVNSPAVAASLCQAAPKLGLAPEQFLTMLSHSERSMLLQALTRGTSSQQEGSAFSLSLPSWSMTGKDIATLVGEIHLGANASAGTLYHELFHTMIGMFRTMDVFSEEDVEVFRKRYGVAPKGTGWLFNEEKAAEEFRKYAEKRARGETTAVKDEADQKAHSIFRKLWEALKSFLNALANGFSHADPHSVTYLFDMVLTGTAAMSREKAQSVGVEKLADNNVFAGTFERLLERSRGDRGAFAPEYGVDEKDLESIAAGRVAKALGAEHDDPFAGFVDEARSTDKVKVPRVSAKGRLAQAAKWSKALEAELMEPRPRVSALRNILRNLVAARGGDVAEDAAYEIPFDPEAETVSWKSAVHMDSALNPETRASMYTPAGVMGRAAARSLVGELSADDLTIIAGASEGKSFVDQLAANSRYKSAAARGSRWAEDYKARMLRQDITVKMGVKHFLRAEGRGDPASDDELKRANDAYMLLVAATPYIKASVRAANRQKGDIITHDGAVTPRSEDHLSAENYAGFLMATGWRDAREYIANARRRLAEAKQSALDSLRGDPSRITRVADHLIKSLMLFEGLDSSSMVSDPGRWSDAYDEFMAQVMTGIKRGDMDLSTGEYSQYSNTKIGDPEPKKATPELRIRNQGLYGFGEAGSKDDELVNQMIRDTVTTVLGVCASARFARSLGVVPGTYSDIPAASTNPPPVDLEKLAEQFRLSTGNIVEGDEDLIDIHCQPAFVSANLDSWYAASLPPAVGNMQLRKVFMEASAKLRGCISAQTNVENFLATYMGIVRTEGNKLLRLVERKGKFEMGRGFWHKVAEGKEPTYIGFDNYHGLNGNTVAVELTEDEYRMVDLFLKSLAVRANGGARYITGANNIRFNVEAGLVPERWTAKESVRMLLETESSSATAVKELSAYKHALARLGLQVQDEMLVKNGLFDDVVAAINEGIIAARGEKLRLELGDEKNNVPPRAITDAEFNDIALAEMERRGVVVCEYDENGMRVSGAFAIDVDRIESAFRASTAFEKLVEAGRDKDFMKGNNLISLYMKGYHELRREVAKQPWLTAGDARFLNNFATPLPFYQGTGNFMYHANRVVRDRRLSAVTRLAKHEATFLSMCSSTSAKVKTAQDLSVPQLNMLRDYFGLDESGDELVKAIVDGKYAKGTKASNQKGLAVDKDTPYLDVAKQIYLKVQERLLLRAEGRSVDELDDDASVLRMIQAYEGMVDSGGATISGAAGISDERMFQLHGVLPMNMQIGHKIHTAMRGIQDALYKRSCLVNMMFTKTVEGNPVFYINPSRYGVEAGGIPDEVWGAMAKWWASRHKSLKYDQRLSGLENARAMYGVISSGLQDGRGVLNGREYESMKQQDLLGQRSVENVLCVKDDPSDSDNSRMNVVGGVGEALGYAKHLFMVDRVPGAAKLQWLDKVMAWTKSLNVMYTAFFPIATKWESATAAVGALATLGSNLSPETLRRHHTAVNALQRLFGGTGWIDENFIGFRDIIEMMDTNDPFLADLVRWAEALGITMSNTVRNPMEPGKGYVAKDIADMKAKMREWGWSSKAASRFGGVLETLFLRSGEKAFTYALNATKLAVTCQIAMKLRHQAELEGRAFDPIRDLSKYAAYIDTEIGGIDPLRYAWAHPQMQAIMNRTLFSWQWTRSAWEAGGGHFFEDLLFGGHTINKETRKYIVGRWLRMYGVVMVGVPMMAQLLIKALAKACGRDDDDDKWFTWENEDKTKWSAFNLTPLMKVVHDHEFTARVVGGGVGALYGAMRGRGIGALVGAAVGAAGVPNYTGRDAANATTRGRKYYMHFGKQGWEFFRWFDKPVEQFFAKLNMPTQRLLEGVFGRNLAYLDRELPFADKGLAERWLSLGADSAGVNMLKAFLPFTVNGVTTFGDAGVASYFGPVQMGASQTNIVDRYVKALKAWADNDRRAYAFGRESSKKRAKEIRRERVADITRDAVMNGIRDPEVLIERAVGQLTPRYYGRLVNLLPERPDDPVDSKEIAKVCRALLRLGATYKGALQSLESRMKTRGVKFREIPLEARTRIVGTLREGFKDPFGTVDGFDYRTPTAYDY